MEDLFNFEENTNDLNYRAQFANRVCKLLVQKHEGHLTNAIEELEPFYNDFQESVRNIYELIDREIPLFALYELMKHGMDNYDCTEEEYDEALIRTRLACINYYI